MSEPSRNRGVWVIAVAAMMTVNATAAEQLVDPTRPNRVSASKTEKTATAPSWRVESIIVSPTRRLATVNGRTVSVGDRVNGAKVAEILPYEVRLEYQGEVRRISLVATRVKHPASEQ